MLIIINKKNGMEKNSKIYIAGHNGMVGSAIARDLRESGYSVIVADKNEALRDKLSLFDIDFLTSSIK